MARILSVIDNEGIEHKLPTIWVICSCCRGEGKSSLYLGAITQGDREPGGSWDDPEAFEDYMNGHYDRPCDECEGSGKVKVVDVKAMKPDLKEIYEADIRDAREMRAIERAERKMGC